MERIYVNLGKGDGFFAGNLIELLNHNVGGKRVDVGRIDLLPHYSLFDVKKADARRVVEGLRGADWMGDRVYSEIADKDKDYARAASRRKRGEAEGEEPETTYDYFLKKSRGGTKKSAK